MAYRSILRPIAPKVENIEQLVCLVKKEVLGTFSYESFLTAEDCNNVSFENFLTAVLEFGANAVKASGDDLRGYLMHLSFMCKMAATKKYDQHMHVAYDKAIRLHAEGIGWPAFKIKIASVANLYYGTENEKQYYDEVDPVESDSEECNIDDPVMVDQHQSNEHGIVSTSETLELQYDEEQNYATCKNEADMKSPETDMLLQSSTVSTNPDIMQHSTEGQTLGQDTQCVKIEYCTPDIEIPVGEQITEAEPSMKLRSERGTRSILKSRTSSSPFVSINGPADIPSVAASAPPSVVSNDPCLKLQEAQQPQKRPIVSHWGKMIKQRSKLKKALRMQQSSTVEIPSGEQITKGEHSMKLKGKTRSILKSRKVSSPVVVIDGPTDLLSGKASAYPIMVSMSSKLKEARLPPVSAKGHICSHCGKQFQRPVNLRNHLRTHTQEPIEETHSCSYCSKQFGSATNLKAHIARHTRKGSPAKTHPCSYCDKKFPKPSLLKVHVRNHTGEAPYSCILCGQKFKRSELLKNHMDKHAGTPFICSYCSKEVSSAAALKAHLLRHTVGLPARPNLCSQCGKQFRSAPDLEVHMRNHTGEKPFSCTICDKKLISSRTLERHMMIHNGEKKYICSHCGWQFFTSSGLNIHTRIHTGEKPHICSYCGKGFRRSGALTKHIRTHTGEKNYKCSECGLGFTDNAGLRRHKTVHTGEKPHICPCCSKIFRERSRLREHIKTWHPQELTGNGAIVPDDESNPHTCSDCGRQFRFLATLKVHMINHTGGNPITCPECGKKSNSSRNLRFHMMTHTQEKPFECSDCDKVFFQPGNLHRHQKTHTSTGEKAHVCSYCDESFAQNADLEVHIKIHTGDKPYVCSACGKVFGMTGYLRRHKRLYCEASRAEKQS